jgi:hypothetical protein
VHTTTHRPGRRRRLSMLTVATLFLSGIAGLVSAIPAEASPAYALYAGTGMSSYNGDDRSALTANLWGPNDLSTDAAGNVYFADRNNKIVRKIDTASTPQIHLVRGTPSVGKLTTDGGLNGPSGVAIQQEDSGASGYIADSYNNVVWRLTGSTPFAGNNCGAGGFNGDGGPANTPGPMVQGCSSPWSSNPAMMNQPGGLGYDVSTGVLYIADTYNCRVRAVSASGTLSTVAGNGACAFGGTGTNATGDTGPATSAPLDYPTDVAARDGKLYIADTSNCRIRWVDLSSGVIQTLAGQGSCSNTGDGNAATSANVQTPKGIDVDSVGNVYFGTGNGAIRMVKTSGVISTVIGIPRPVVGLTRDLKGNLYASVDWDQIYKVTGNNSSATVSNVSSAVTPSNPLYTMNVSFNLSGVTCPAKARITIGANLTRYKPLCSAGQSAPTSGTASAISVLSLNPQTSYPVAVTVDDANGTSTTATGTVLTPKVPLILALGDSISSSHHRETPEASMTCDDPNYGYPRYFRDAVRSALPTQWAPAYVNLAHSGFSTDDVINNGANACGDTPADVPLTKAETLLGQNAGSWNFVVATASIDDTNWGDVLSTVGSHSATQVIYTKEECTTDMSSWTGWQETTGQHISTDIGSIVDGLKTADPAVRVKWLGYYNISGTGPIPSVCKDPFDDALTKLSGYITTGLSGRNVPLVTVDSTINGQSSLLQAYQLPWDMAQGWPHPNSAGAAAIAGAIQP